MELREQIAYDKGYRHGRAVGKTSVTFRLGLLIVLVLILIDVFDVRQPVVMAIPFGAIAIEAWLEGRKLKATTDLGQQ